MFFLQFAPSWLSARIPAVHRLVRHEPTLLFRNGRMLDDAIKKQRLTEGEVRAAVRSEGHAALEDVEAVILESDGSLSVIAKRNESTSAISSDIEGVPA